MSELWLPGGALDIDDFVRRVHQQVERFAEAQGLTQAMVEVELRDGAHYVLDAISPEPGYGFVTLRPHGTGSEEPQELIVPLASVAQIRISTAEKEPQFGFALPEN